MGMAERQDLTRQRLLQEVADLVSGKQSSGILRVAIDGVDGAGKTTFAGELAAALMVRNKSVIRASVDGFHNPRAIRYRQGRNSPSGYFLDSYDYPGLRQSLLDPLSPGGTGLYKTAIFDHISDSPVVMPAERADVGSILVFDGIFLHRPELVEYWDCSIFLEVDFSVSIPRCAQRPDGLASTDPRSPDNYRYVEGQRLYLNSCRPYSSASVVVDNNDLSAPRLLRSPANQSGRK